MTCSGTHTYTNTTLVGFSQPNVCFIICLLLHEGDRVKHD